MLYGRSYTQTNFTEAVGNAPSPAPAHTEQEFSRTTCFAKVPMAWIRQPSPNGPRRISTTNTSDPTPHSLPTNRLEQNVPQNLSDNGETSLWLSRRYTIVFNILVSRDRKANSVQISRFLKKHGDSSQGVGVCL